MRNYGFKWFELSDKCVFVLLHFFVLSICGCLFASLNCFVLKVFVKLSNACVYRHHPAITAELLLKPEDRRAKIEKQEALKTKSFKNPGITPGKNLRSWPSTNLSSAYVERNTSVISPQWLNYELIIVPELTQPERLYNFWKNQRF